VGLHSLWALGAAVAAAGLFAAGAVREERALAERFPAEWKTYAAEVRRRFLSAAGWGAVILVWAAALAGL
jgi:protein-S-isoprenylcysteine O-methyltransferase Ste14